MPPWAIALSNRFNLALNTAGVIIGKSKKRDSYRQTEGRSGSQSGSRAVNREVSREVNRAVNRAVGRAVGRAVSQRPIKLSIVADHKLINNTASSAFAIDSAGSFDYLYIKVFIELTNLWSIRITEHHLHAFGF